METLTMVGWLSIISIILVIGIAWVLEYFDSKRRNKITEEVRAIAKQIDKDREVGAKIWREYIKKQRRK